MSSVRRGPCPRRWNELVGDGARRFCRECSTVVHDLDALSNGEVAELIRANPNGFCATFIADGSERFRRGAAGWARALPRAATVTAAVVAAVVGCTSPPEAEPSPDHAPEATVNAPRVEQECTNGAPIAKLPKLSPEESERLRYLGYVE